MFTQEDINQIEGRGSDQAVVAQQIKNFETGFPFASVVKAATVGDGIIRLSEEDADEMANHYQMVSNVLKVLKFVPASGAASRMFKSLFSYKSELENGTAEAPKGDLHDFFDCLPEFAFYNDLAASMGGIVELEKAEEEKDYLKILDYVLTDKGLNYGQLPKGLLAFHKYEGGARTPFEEHMVEGANYGKDADSNIALHFTISPEHRHAFVKLLNNIHEAYTSTYEATFDIGFSEQKASTDTIAVDMENKPFRNADGTLLFRPGGHGALIENLNDIKADVIFIKNIDNVVPDRIKGETYRYKKALAGVLLTYQQRIFDFVKSLPETDDDEWIAQVESFLEKELCVMPPAGYADDSKFKKIHYLLGKLMRPVRVCGMVKNEGEPGGGPFWTRNSDGTVSLQIIESAQFDSEDESQMNLMKGATHFNPVDLICAPNNHEGEKYNLLDFVDPQAGFIAYKSKDGRELKAQELPGLWNGAMANWNTLFVEVPIITFNPVKTVNDLLRANHQ